MPMLVVSAIWQGFLAVPFPQILQRCVCAYRDFYSHEASGGGVLEKIEEGKVW